MIGLPEEVKFCKKCVISNQRPNSTREYSHVKESRKETIHFDEEGVCDACRVAEQKKQIDWAQREAALVGLCDQFRSKTGAYDCVVPGSGGKDSFYAAHVLKEKYGMHPLLCTWGAHIYTEWGARNLERWQHLGDHYLVTPKRSTHALLTRLAIENIFHPFQPFIIGQKSLGPKVASLFNIPLVFYGESEAEYGNPKADTSSPLRDRSLYTGSSIALGGVPLDDLYGRFGLGDADVSAYLPCSQGDLVRVGVEVHYLGYYLKWHPQSCYYYAADLGFEAAPERSPGTYSKYNSIDDKIDDFHYLTTFIKFGIGRATYDAAQEIRSGDITRDEGVALVHRFDGEFPERFEKEVFEYLSVPGFPPMTREYFWELADKFRSPHLWECGSDGTWELKHKVK